MKALGRASLSAWLKRALDVAWVLALVVSGLLVIEGLNALVDGPLAVRLNLLVPFDLDPAAYAIESERLGVEGAAIYEATGELRFRSGSRGLVLMWFLVVLPVVIAALVVLHQLRRVFQSLAAGDPFVRANATRIRVIGFVVLAMEVVRVLALLGQAYYLEANFAFSAIQLRMVPRPDLGVLFLGLVLLVIAEVFRQGADLREEQSLTV